MEYVKLLKSSIKRYLLSNRVYSINISLNHYSQKVKGILTIYKGVNNSFVCLKTLQKEKRFKNFYEIPLNEQPFEKLTQISKSYIIDQCQFNYKKGIQWIRKDSSPIYPENPIYVGIVRVSQDDISSIRKLKKRKDERIININEKNEDSNDDFIQFAAFKEDNNLIIKPLWDLPIRGLKNPYQDTDTDAELNRMSSFIINQIKIVYDGEKKQLFVIQENSVNNSQYEKQSPTNIYKLDCLNQQLRRSKFNPNTQHLQLIEVIEVPDHVNKQTCKLQIIHNKQTNEFLIRSFHKQVHELKIPAHNLSIEKLLQLYYFYFDQMAIKYLKKQKLEQVVFQMRKFRVMNKLKFYQVKTKHGNYGDLILFQGKKSTIIILKIMYKDKKNNLSRIHILGDINEIILIMERIEEQVVNIYTVLSYRQVENQDFQFYNIAALWDQENKDIILKADDLSIPPVIIKKQKLTYRQALFQGEELLQQAILYKDPETGKNTIDI